MSEPVSNAKSKLLPARLKPVDIVVNEWSAVSEAGVPFDLIKGDPLYWAHNAKMLRIGDIIHLRCDDGAYYARLYVRGVRGNAVDVAVLEQHDFTKLAPADADIEIEYRAEFAGPHHKWRIIRIKDGVAVQTGIDGKQAALEAIAGLTKKAA